MEHEEMNKQAQEELKRDEGFRYNEARVQDSKATEYDPYSLLHLPIDRIPEPMQKRMVKVFSKHDVKDVKEWGQKLMKSYQLLHAIEKPMDLNYVKPFANTSDLVKKTPIIDANEAKKKEEAEKSAKKDDKEKKTIELEPDQEDAENMKPKDPKKKSKSQMNQESERQEFVLDYQREHAVAYLYKKFPYNYMVIKRVLHEIH